MSSSSSVRVPHSNSDRTLGMEVENMGFLLDRLGQDCAPLQFLRELTVNAIEAIQALPEPKGEIVWDFEKNASDWEGVYKLCIIDTGAGMTGPEMVKYINHLSSSGRPQSIDGNYGVGAKISAATRNHEGVLYFSWKQGKGATIHLWRNPETGTYGLRQMELPGGNFSHWAALSDEFPKPEPIKDHGTMVVLLGNKAEDDTMEAPPKVATPSRWIARYLNSRFFEFPEGIAARAREGWRSKNTDTNVLRTVKGSRDFLEKYKSHSGSVDVGGAVAQWWILRDADSVSQASGANLPGGHVAALHQNELYELQTSRSGVSMLQRFGIHIGHQRVVIYLQPKTSATARITSNTARTHLLMDGEPLPWAEWAEAFRDRFPDEIKSLIDSISRDKEDPDYEKSIKDRLKEIEDILRVQKYRPARDGSLRISDETSLGDPDSGTETRLPRGGNRSGGGGRRAGDIYTFFLVDDGGQPGEAVRDRFDVKVEWVPEIEMPVQDRAAHYVPDTRTLLINQDFRIFTGFVDRWEKRYRSAPGAKAVIMDVVHEWFQQTLVEVIYSVDFLRGSRQWTEDEVERAYSDEALTTAVLPRYHTEMAVRRALGTKLGALGKEKST
jgi:hypothetical protein